MCGACARAADGSAERQSSPGVWQAANSSSERHTGQPATQTQSEHNNNLLPLLPLSYWASLRRRPRYFANNLQGIPRGRGAYRAFRDHTKHRSLFEFSLRSRHLFIQGPVLRKQAVVAPNHVTPRNHTVSNPCSAVFYYYLFIFLVLCYACAQQ